MSNRAPKTAAPPAAEANEHHPDTGPSPSDITPGPPEGAESGDGDSPPPPPLAAGGEPGSRDPLDHDGDGRKGGVADAPTETHLVVLQDDADRGLNQGEVIAVADADVKGLLAEDVCRAATPAEVELAQPRVRPWAHA